MIASELPQKALRNPTVRPRGFQTEVLQHLHSQSLCRCLLATSLDEASLDEKTENYVPKPVFSIHHPQKSPFLRFFSPQMVNFFGTFCLTRTDMTIFNSIHIIVT